jgi:choline dehydrogenase-like flavoprotein
VRSTRLTEHCEILVIGSGAGGAVVAATLAEAGRDVLVLEEGTCAPETLDTHSPGGLRRLYRNGALFPMLGNPPIAFAEGRCLGGGTEVNSAFWHRAPESAIHRWEQSLPQGSSSLQDLPALYDELEETLGIVRAETPSPPPNSRLLKEGAEAMGWSVREVPRAQSNNVKNPYHGGTRRSMSRTYLPRAHATGARVLVGTKAEYVAMKGRRAQRVRVKGAGNLKWITCRHLFVCAGAVQTPVLLRRSGFRSKIGNTLGIHPMVKVAAEFDESLHADRYPLPFYQVTQFWPDLTLGGSVFTPGYLGVTLAAGNHGWQPLERWQHMGLYYAAICPKAQGKIRVAPFTHEACVLYSLNKADIALLYEGLERLCKLLFRAGAIRLYPGLKSCSVLTEPQSFAGWKAKNLSLSAVHSFGSCPLGLATDSYGRLHGADNVTLADASLFPDSPGVNPQATVMALALRNARRFLK